MSTYNFKKCDFSRVQCLGTDDQQPCYSLQSMGLPLLTQLTIAQGKSSSLRNSSRQFPPTLIFSTPGLQRRYYLAPSQILDCILHPISHLHFIIANPATRLIGRSSRTRSLAPICLSDLAQQGAALGGPGRESSQGCGGPGTPKVKGWNAHPQSAQSPVGRTSVRT